MFALTIYTYDELFIGSSNIWFYFVRYTVRGTGINNKSKIKLKITSKFTSNHLHLKSIALEIFVSKFHCEIN